MKVIVLNNYEEVSEEAFRLIKSEVLMKEDAVLGLATGSTPIRCYENMVKDHQENGTSYKNVVTFNLDEYVGLDKNHSESYFTFMNKNLFSGLDINLDNVHIPLGDTDDLDKSCKDYEAAMKDYRVDVQLLGIGANGHIGFNEPGTSFDSLTHVVELQEKTRDDNARFFEPLNEEVPTHAITMGIATIMKAKKIVLIATGKNKAEAVRKMIKDDISEDCPASILHKHEACLVFLDSDAASLL